MEAIGSYASGFAAMGSDLDCTLLRQGENQFSVTKGKKVAILNDLAERLTRAAPSSLKTTSFAVAQYPSPDMASPVLTLIVDGRHKVDIGVNGFEEVQGANFLYAYSRHWLVQGIGLLAKTWARSHGLVDTKAGLLSSFDIVLMVVSWAQAQKTQAWLQTKPLWRLGSGGQEFVGEAWESFLNYFHTHLVSDAAVCVDWHLFGQSDTAATVGATTQATVTSLAPLVGYSDVQRKLTDCRMNADNGKLKVAIMEPFRQGRRLRAVTREADTLKIQRAIVRALSRSVPDACSPDADEIEEWTEDLEERRRELEHAIRTEPS